MYTKKSSVLFKQDLKSIPFNEIHEIHYEKLNAAKAACLASRNFELKERWSARHYDSGESVDDSTPDFTPMSTLSREEVAKLDLQVSTEVVSAFVKRYNLDSLWTWLGPQLLAYLSTYRLPSTTEIDGKEFLNLNVLTKSRDMGIWRMLTKVPRSTLMSIQTKPEHVGYSSLVPLYMAAQKQFNKVPYSAWDRETAAPLMDATLYKSASYDIPKELRAMLTQEELVQIRNRGLTHAGGVRKPTTYHKLHGIKDSLIGGFPTLLQAMLTQIWVAHPANRTSLMILDPDDWDHMPTPLITTKILIQNFEVSENITVPTTEESPW